MADLSIEFCGVRSPNPFWLASAPPTNTGDQVMRAFDAGWGGAVWKTLGNPIVNVSSRFGGIDYGTNRLMGLNNVELITDGVEEVREQRLQPGFVGGRAEILERALQRDAFVERHDHVGRAVRFPEPVDLD